MGVAAVQHSDFLFQKAVVWAIAFGELLHLIHHPGRLRIVAGRLHHPHRLARALAGAQVFAETLAVVADQLIRRIQNIAAAAVIFFQLDLVFNLEFAHKIRHVAHACAAKGVNALVVVTHGHHIARGFEVCP